MARPGSTVIALGVSVIVVAGLVAYVALEDDASPSASPAPRMPLEVTVDASGRPYDVSLPRRATLERRPLTTLVAPSRRIVTLGGEEVAHVRAGEHPVLTLAERSPPAYRIDAIWLHDPRVEPKQTVGIVVVERPGTVVRWKELQRVAYGTDAGLGAITTVEWTERPKGFPNEISERYDEDLIAQSRQWFAADVDGEPGNDTLIFSNGFGDGGFPSVAGYDAAGRRVAVVLWTVVVPWRLAFPVGTPPTQVTRREAALRQCLAGRRLVDGARCRLRR